MPAETKPTKANPQRSRQHDTALSQPHSGAIRRALWNSERSWHIPFALKLGIAISAIAVIGAVVLAYLSVVQHLQLLERQGDAFGETIVEQLAGSLVEPVFTDDQLAIQLQLNQLAKKRLFMVWHCTSLTEYS